MGFRIYYRYDLVSLTVYPQTLPSSQFKNVSAYRKQFCFLLAKNITDISK